jgi:hypothetical protein
MSEILDPTWIAAFSLLITALGAIALVARADLPGV